MMFADCRIMLEREPGCLFKPVLEQFSELPVWSGRNPFQHHYSQIRGELVSLALAPKAFLNPSSGGFTAV